MAVAARPEHPRSIINPPTPSSQPPATGLFSQNGSTRHLCEDRGTRSLEPPPSRLINRCDFFFRGSSFSLKTDCPRDKGVEAGRAASFRSLALNSKRRFKDSTEKTVREHRRSFELPRVCTRRKSSHIFSDENYGACGHATGIRSDVPSAARQVRASFTVYTLEGEGGGRGVVQ